ncbi:MAG: ABC transporter permease [Candidatus Methanomethyliaceae archaeon]|nr:ABC transporter permease [Candidatus Methanomethyliaceae archaeon]MDW7970574.1 FtsX-like permease family protein [Nitrososphaerota archaeon]
MNATDVIIWGLKGIRERKLRAALTILGIVIGTAAVISLISQTEGIQKSIIDQMNKLGPNTISVRPASAVITLTDKDVNKILQISNVDLVIPAITGTIRLYGSQSSRTFQLVGIDPGLFGILISGYEIREGRMYQALGYAEVVVGSNVNHPQDLTMEFVSVGQTATIETIARTNRKVVNVVGVIAPYGMTSLISVDDSIFMSLQGAANFLGRTSYSVLFIKVNAPENVESVVNNIRAIYGNTLNIMTVKQITDIVTSITGQLTVLLGSIAAISLFVAGLGIMNIMFVSVIERTKEIGVLKALGFKNREVLAIFLSEAGIIGLIGGFIGILVGSGISLVLPIVVSMGFRGFQTGISFYYQPLIRPEMAFLIFIFAIGVSLLAGLYPARRASKMDPVVALRHE